MVGETVSMAEASASKAIDSRQRSTIGFPYIGLNDALRLVSAIHGNVGLGDCDDSQLAAWTGQSANSSGFRVQLSGARMFSLLATDGSGRHRITEIGQKCIDPAREREGKATAFLNVPLYKALFEKYKTSILPPNAAALEREMVSLGVSDKVKDRARQSFEKSAESAGFFEHGRNKLVMPGFAPSREQPGEDLSRQDNNGGMGSGGGGPQVGPIDPIIQGLLARLPRAGEVWPEAERNLWLDLLKGSFKLIYKEPPTGAGS